MKNINVVIAIMVCLFISTLKAQNINFVFKNGLHKSYSLSDVRSITFTNNVMNLNKNNGTTDSWNVKNIGQYSYNDLETNIEELRNEDISDLFIYPNPTQGPINLQYHVQQVGDVVIGIWDINGKLIKTLTQKQQEIGNYTISWNGVDDNGKYINSGVYFCRLTIGSTSVSKKIIVTNQ